MSPYTNFHAPKTSLSGRIQIGQKSGFYYYYLLFYLLFSVNIKPPRHRFGFSLAWDWQLASLVCVCECTKSGTVEWRCFFPEHLIFNFFRLKVKVKVDLLKLTLKLVFPHNYFQILRQKYSKSLSLENVKVRRF
jgi:hypothetical protein